VREEDTGEREAGAHSTTPTNTVRRDGPAREPSLSAFWLQKPSILRACVREEDAGEREAGAHSTTPTYTVRRDGPAREPSWSAFWLQKPSILRACVREEDAGGREAGAPLDLKMPLENGAPTKSVCLLLQDLVQSCLHVVYVCLFLQDLVQSCLVVRNILLVCVLGTECIHNKGGAHSSKTHLILIQACDPRPSRIGNLVSVHPRCGGTCRIGVLRARAGAHPPAPARNRTQGFAAARRCRRTWDGIALAQTQTRASCVRQHATLNTKTGRQRVTAAALLR
jgi:hypothetical protein